MASTYGLYQTFASHEEKEDLTIDEKLEVKESIKSMTIEQKKAVLFLIIEHAKIEDGYIYSSEDFSLPYGLVQYNLNNVHFELDSLPIPLKWVLFKFTKLLKNEITP
jgi:hypothetical protein